MKILISIVLNTLILWALYYFMWWNEDLPAGIQVEWWFVAFVAWWVILWLINATIKPVLKILALPFFFLFFWLASLFINGACLWLLEYILNNILKFEWISYHINYWFDFIVTVAIFSILNIIYTLILNK